MDVLDRLFRRLVQNIRAGHPQYLKESFSVGELFQTLVPYRHNRAEIGIEMNQDYEAALMRLLAGERGYLVGEPAMQTALCETLAAPHPDTTRYRDFADARVSLNADAAALVEPAPPARAAAPDQPTVAMGAARPVPPPSRPALANTGVMSTHGSSEGFREAGGEPPAPPPPRLVAEPERNEAEAAFPDPSAFGFPLRTPIPGAPQRPSGSGGQPVVPVSPAATTPSGAQGPAGILAQGSCRYCGGTLPDGRRITYCPHCGQNLTVRQCPACSTELELGWRFCVTCGRQVT